MKDAQLQQIVDKTIMEADKDGDGKLSFEEFSAMVSNTVSLHSTEDEPELMVSIGYRQANDAGGYVLINHVAHSTVPISNKQVNLSFNPCVCSVSVLVEEKYKRDNKKMQLQLGDMLNYRKLAYS